MQKSEIIWNLVNSGLAGLLVFLGSFVDGTFTWKEICVAIVASLVIFITKFREYWLTEEGEYKNKKGGVFNFL